MKNCTPNTLSNYIRIVLSIVVIVLGIVYKNWLGLLGLLTLASALTGGGCPFVIKFDRDNGFRPGGDD